MLLKDTTLLLTNYMRPTNVLKIVERFKDFMPITIINNNSAYDIPKNFYAQTIYNNSSNRYCIDRWHRVLDCETEYVCILDDDILPYKKTILDLRKISESYPNSLVGIYGQTGTINANSYEELEDYWCREGQVEIVAGTCLIVHKIAIEQIFTKYIKPMGIPDRGDDIIISLALTKHFGDLHKIITTEVEVLPEFDVGLNRDKDYHYARRWKMIQKCRKKFNI